MKKSRKFRMCIDYRKLNVITKKDRYPLPRIEEIINSFKGAQYFSILDLTSGFWQIQVKPEDQEKTAFIVPGTSGRPGTPYRPPSLYEFTVMPFGLCNAPATFQRNMNEIFFNEIGDFIIVYMDDIIIFSKTLDEYMDHLRRTFNRLRSYGMKINREKCQFAQDSLVFLGYIIGKDGIRTDPAKIKKVQDFPSPRNAKEIRAFLGLTGFYSRFIQDYTQWTEPLRQLLKKNA